MQHSAIVRFGTFSLAVVSAVLTGFFASVISKSVDLYRLACDPWGWSVTRDLRGFAVADFVLALPFILAAAWLMKKTISSRYEVIAVIVAAVIAGWFGI